LRVGSVAGRSTRSLGIIPMNFATLIGKRLKDDDVVEILDASDITVTYDFDRTHENIDDVYWAEAKNHGFVLRFNKHQVIDTVFLYVSAKDGYSPIDRGSVDVPVYDSIEGAETSGSVTGIPYQRNGEMKSFPGAQWIKFDHGGYTVHYQFNDQHLSLITISAAKRMKNDA
jgi:hypothetical protein